MLVRATSGITIAPKLPEEISSRMTILTAAQGDQVASWDFKARHGMFTKHLLDALYGAADQDDIGNGDNKVVLAEVTEYLVDYMTRAARRTYGRHQEAWVVGNGATVLANVAPKAAKPKNVVKKLLPPTPKPTVQTAVVQPSTQVPKPKISKADKENWIIRFSAPNTGGRCLQNVSSITAKSSDGSLQGSGGRVSGLNGRGSVALGYFAGEFWTAGFLGTFKLVRKEVGWSGAWKGSSFNGYLNLDCEGLITMVRTDQ